MTPFDPAFMLRAIELAYRGEGAVEPNPMVGCVLMQGGKIVAEGWHERFGGPHAEINALADAHRRGIDPAGCEVYVTLEPCSHHGKTPPCVNALLAAGVKRLAVAQIDPFPAVAGRGVAALSAAGVAVEVGLCEREASELNAPYLKLVEAGRPWIIAKWAMTLDGKLASRSGDSRWISNESSRRIVHELRGRMDGILIGIGTVLADNPLLTARNPLPTARPPGQRILSRIVLDSRARLPLESQLVLTAKESPTIVVVGPEADNERVAALRDSGCELLTYRDADRRERLAALLEEFGRRRMTNLLVEGGSHVLGDFFDNEWVDEVFAFIAPKIVGGADAQAPVAGRGRDLMSQAMQLRNARTETLDGDVFIRGRVERATSL
jgi:diaminohydroxyphosphoribosylaminopyrimidine deaminase/5-amino-6-(5-phosphoribosylamino)uracil reductase